MTEQTQVLVVDDELLIRFDLAATIEEAGYLVHSAASAKEALGILEANNQIKIVLTDINMPGDMDGLKLAHVIRERWPPTILIICSGNIRPADDQLPQMATFVPKPCEASALKELLKSLDA